MNQGSESKTGVSKAARELAEALFPDFTPEIHVGYADVIQSHLAELLEKAETLRRVYAACYEEEHGNLPKSITDFDAVAEPWPEPKPR